MRTGLCCCAFGTVTLLASGCSWTDSRGTHHLIVGLGLGIITTTNSSGIEVRNSHVLGSEFVSGGIGVGLMQHHHVVIDPNLASNAVVSIKATPFSLTIKTFDPYSTKTNAPTAKINERN